MRLFQWHIRFMGLYLSGKENSVRLTQPRLLSAEPKDRSYKLRNRNSMCQRDSAAGSKTRKFERV